MQLSDYIKEYRNKHGLSQREFATKSGLSNGYISLLEKGENPKTGQPITPTLDTYKIIARSTDVSINKLFSIIDDAPIEINSAPINIDIRPINRQSLPVIGKIACGTPKFANEELSFYIETGNEVKADFCLVASGDSMIDARIYDGDIVFIRKQDTVDNGDIAAVIIDDEATLKRVYYYPEAQLLVLRPENRDFDEITYSGEDLDHVHILGKAVAFQSTKI